MSRLASVLAPRVQAWNPAPPIKAFGGHVVVVQLLRNVIDVFSARQPANEWSAPAEFTPAVVPVSEDLFSRSFMQRWQRNRDDLSKAAYGLFADDLVDSEIADWAAPWTHFIGTAFIHLKGSSFLDYRRALYRLA